MLSTFIVVRLIYQSLVCDASVQSIPFDCPTGCRCEGTQVESCTIETLNQYPDVGETAHIETLSVSFCHQSDFNSLSTDTKGNNPFSRMNCDRLVLLDGREYSNCIYKSTNIPTKGCIYMCSKSNIALVSKKQNARKKTRKCICYMCMSSVRPQMGVMRVRRSTDGNEINKTLTRTDVNETRNGDENKKENENLPFLILIAALSIIAFLINFIVMIKLCCSSLTVIDLFGTALMLFNVILSMYGMSMAFYLFRPSMAKDVKYCQFFASIKLFSLGSALYTMTALIFHRPIRRSGGDGSDRGEVEEVKMKGAKKDAVFKGIVLILEGVMLAGVLGVLSWIKTRDWENLCEIIHPDGPVDGLLRGIEVWYFALCGLLVCWYIGNYLYRKYLIFKAYREKCKRKQNGEDGEDGEGLLRDENCDEPESEEIAPYITQDFPIFILVSISFCIWIGGFILTLPGYNLFNSNISSVIRVCTLILPIIVQPVVYVIRDTCCCKCPCLLGSKHRSNTVEEIKLNKCQSEDSSPSDNNLQVETTTFENAAVVTQLPIGKVEQDLNEEPSVDEETGPLNKGNKKKTNEFELPIVVCRSPIQSDEHSRLLDDTDGKNPPPPTIVVGELDITPEYKGLTNGEKDIDENGRASRGPTFYPIASETAETRQKQSDLKNYTPIKEKNTEEDEEKEDEIKKINNNRKEKRKEKKGPKKTNSSNSTASLEWDSYSCSDSSSSQEEASSDINSIAVTGKTEWDPNKFEGTTSPTELTKFKNKINQPHYNNNNNNNNNYEDLVPGEMDSLLNSSTNSSDPVSKDTSNTNHTSKKLKKPLLTRDDSGSVER